jgi:hypothetical protein
MDWLRLGCVDLRRAATFCNLSVRNPSEMGVISLVDWDS